jgi:hypothetical protein
MSDLDWQFGEELEAFLRRGIGLEDGTIDVRVFLA